MSKFKVGEIAIVIDASSVAAANVECEIIAQPGHNEQWLKGDRYVIFVPGHNNRFHDNGYWSCSESNLRKKQPPQRECDELTTWDKCLWKPSEVRA